MGFLQLPIFILIGIFMHVSAYPADINNEFVLQQQLRGMTPKKRFEFACYQSYVYSFNYESSNQTKIDLFYETAAEGLVKVREPKKCKLFELKPKQLTEARFNDLFKKFNGFFYQSFKKASIPEQALVYTSILGWKENEFLIRLIKERSWDLFSTLLDEGQLRTVSTLLARKDIGSYFEKTENLTMIQARLDIESGKFNEAKKLLYELSKSSDKKLSDSAKYFVLQLPSGLVSNQEYDRVYTNIQRNYASKPFSKKYPNIRRFLSMGNYKKAYMELRELSTVIGAAGATRIFVDSYLNIIAPKVGVNVHEAYVKSLQRSLGTPAKVASYQCLALSRDLDDSKSFSLCNTYLTKQFGKTSEFIVDRFNRVIWSKNNTKANRTKVLNECRKEYSASHSDCHLISIVDENLSSTKK